MYKETNTGTNLPAQIDLYSVDGNEYNSCVSLKAVVCQQNLPVSGNQSLVDAGKTEKFLVDKMRSLGTAACPPYHIALLSVVHQLKAR